MPLGAAILSVGLMAFATPNSFRLDKKIEYFDEINVKRINIIAKDGTGENLGNVYHKNPDLRGKW